jgi:nitroimidazol reductase NimA-like FMN-containing flavoprotein (pyridoxamine 5'-phosphate oxidase superfamily)
VDALPEWPDGTVATLSTCGGEPHAIPVSTAVRAGPLTVLFVLARRRESLARLRTDPRCAFTIVTVGVAFTALGRAVTVDEDDRVATVRLDVERIQDHMQPTFQILEGVRWRWTDPAAARSDAALRTALRERRHPH